MYAVILTNATRHLWIKNNCQYGYDYKVICKMRENIHNKILEDINNWRQTNNIKSMGGNFAKWGCRLFVI